MPSTRGVPRAQYERTYVLLPPGAGREWVNAIIEKTWNKHRLTFGGSADDAGIGDLDVRRVVAINPHLWTGDLKAFFEKYYPGVEYIPVKADTPDKLVLFPESPPPPPPASFTLRGGHDLAFADWLLSQQLTGWCVEALYLDGGAVKLTKLPQYAAAGIRPLLRLSWSYAASDGGKGAMPLDEYELKVCEDRAVATMEQNPAAWGFIYCNEPNRKGEWPKGHVITPEFYAASYNRVYARKPASAKLSPAPIDPTTGGWGDWRETLPQMFSRLKGAEFLALHAYGHGAEVSTVWGNRCFSDPPLAGAFYDLRMLEGQMAVLPKLPVVVTETNHLTRADGKDGWEPILGALWLEEAYKYFALLDILGACAFRYGHVDWRFSDKPAILEVLRRL